MVDWYPWSSFHSLVVTNRSARGNPQDSTALPTPTSLPYRDAVSMLRYPASIAASTADRVWSSGTRKTPNPICGISTPLFNITAGTSIVAITSSWPLFSAGRPPDALEGRRCPARPWPGASPSTGATCILADRTGYRTGRRYSGDDNIVVRHSSPPPNAYAR